MSSNIQRLGDTLSDRMGKTSRAAVPTTVELGVINSNMSLTTDSLKTPIPQGQYMVNLILSGGSYSTSTTEHTHDGGSHGGHESGDGSHTHDGGKHAHSLPSVFRGLRRGDRVMVIWCGNEPVVVAIVVSS